MVLNMSIAQENSDIVLIRYMDLDIGSAQD